MSSPTTKSRPSPDRIFETLNAYQQTAALRAAIALDIFTKIGEGADTSPALAKRCEATERGVRILCDYLVVHGFLTKRDDRYSLTDESATFLDRRSPACIASAAGFLTLPVTINAYHDLARTIRTGQPAMADGEGSISAENPIWVEFARSMAPMVTPSAEEIARLLDAAAGKKWKVLDLAGGHGMFGITLAQAQSERRNLRAGLGACADSRHGECARRGRRGAASPDSRQRLRGGIRHRLRRRADDEFPAPFRPGHE